LTGGGKTVRPAAGAPDATDFAMASATARMSESFVSVRRWLAGAVLAAAIAAPGAAFAQVVVIANGSPITAYDIEQRMKLISVSTHKTPTREEVINELIDDRLKIAKAKTYGFEVPEAEVENAYNAMAKNQHLTTQQFDQLLERSGLVANTIKARIRAELTWNQLVRGKFSASLDVNESEILKALRTRNESPAETLGFVYTLYPVMVLVPAGSNADLVEAKRREAEALRSRFSSCKTGLAFARALRDVAVREPITRSSGELAPPMREVLDNMAIGQLTKPDVTPQGLQMFALCEKKESKNDSPLAREIRQQLFAKRFEAEANRFLAEIRKQAMIEYKEPKDAK
jgi:peptidyl-prolyl cis-trans isomerase SurA